MGMVRGDILTTYFGITWSRATNKKTHQPKELVNQNGDINVWKRRGVSLLTFTTPVLPVDTTNNN